MGFKKGQSGNPLGRKIKSAEVREVEALAKQHGPDAVTRLKFWLASNDGRISVAAANALLDRGFGKPAQSLKHSGPDGGPLVIKWDE